MEPSFTNPDDIHLLGDSLYEQMRETLETTENIGRLISIDVKTGDYEIGDDLLITGQRLQARHPDAIMVSKCIGYDAVYTIGGTLKRTSRS